MDFSSNVMIDFGLNLIGYLVTTVLIYNLISRRQRKVKIAPPNMLMSEGKQVTPPHLKTNVQAIDTKDSEYIPLAGASFPSHPKPLKATVLSENRQIIPIGRNTSRQENRKAIYLEARRLLAGGRSRNDIMTRLPLTENEADMLSASGNV